MATMNATPAVPGQGRVVLIVTSPRVAPGLLTGQAWQFVTAADTVLAVDPGPAWLETLAAAGVSIQDLAEHSVAVRAGRLLEAVDGGRQAVWLGSPDGDPGLTDALAEHLSRRAVAGMPPEVELVTGSFDVPGSRLLDLVAVMDRLRSPGGCPWDAEQTHLTLLPYLLEETHEVIEAVESGDRAHLAEELGDLLLQVVFHARMAQDDVPAPFDIDDVAAGIVAKLVRRHPHVFGIGDGAVEVSGAAEVAANWEQLKAAEKQREGLFDGIPASLPSLARAQKMLGRLTRAAAEESAAEESAAEESAAEEPAAAESDVVAARLTAAAAGDELALTLLRVVQQLAAQGRDAEGSLRAVLNRLASGSM